MVNIPNFFLVGASKAGTTSIHEALDTHEEIFMCDPKEPNFFNAFDESELTQEALDEYYKLYDNAADAKIIGEASVDYFNSTKAAEYIYKFQPNAKIVFVLRNPLERIRSLYEMYVRHGLKQSFKYCTETDPWLVQQCRYFDTVKRFTDVFDSAQIKWLLYEDIKNNWSDTMSEILDFLEVNNSELIRPVKKNIGGVPKSKYLSILTNRKLINYTKSVLPSGIHNYVDGVIKKTVFKKKKLTKTQLVMLKREFEEDLARLGSLLDYDFDTIWLK